MADLSLNIIEEDQPTHPKVLCDVATGTCKIEGLSFMENSRAFYKPVVEWIHNFLKTHDKPLKLVIRISYLNSSSSKIFFDLFADLSDYLLNGKQISCEWYFPTYDEEIEEDIDDMIAESGFDILKKPF